MKIKKDYSYPQHIRFEDSSDEENEPTVKKLRFDSKKKETSGKNSSHAVDQKVEPSSEDIIPKKTKKKSKSDTTKSSEKKTSHVVEQEGESLCEEISQLKSEKKKKEKDRDSKITKKELICPVCEDGGFWLRCDCGHESQSGEHLSECKVANCTVIRKKDGPIQTFHDKKVTPQCIMCEMYPKNLNGYAGHLVSHHKTTLREARRYLICSCGFKVTCKADKNHRKECDGRKFTLHKFDEK